MRAIDRLHWTRCEFDNSWQAHAAGMRSVAVLELSKNLAPSLAVSLQVAKGFAPEFDGVAAVEDLFDELKYLRPQDFGPLRTNCLLGVCASFESFAKTYAACLEYDQDWRSTIGTPGCLAQETEADFTAKFSDADKRWRGKCCVFLKKEFDWLDDGVVDGVDEVMWLRNQVAHNGGFAREGRWINTLQVQIAAGEAIALDGRRLGACVNVIRACVTAIANGTPYADAI